MRCEAVGFEDVAANILEMGRQRLAGDYLPAGLQFSRWAPNNSSSRAFRRSSGRRRGARFRRPNRETGTHRCNRKARFKHPDARSTGTNDGAPARLPAGRRAVGEAPGDPPGPIAPRHFVAANMPGRPRPSWSDQPARFQLAPRGNRSGGARFDRRLARRRLGTRGSAGMGSFPGWREEGLTAHVVKVYRSSDVGRHRLDAGTEVSGSGIGHRAAISRGTTVIHKRGLGRLQQPGTLPAVTQPEPGDLPVEIGRNAARYVEGPTRASAGVKIDNWARLRLMSRPRCSTAARPTGRSPTSRRRSCGSLERRNKCRRQKAEGRMNDTRLIESAADELKAGSGRGP